MTRLNFRHPVLIPDRIDITTPAGSSVSGTAICCQSEKAEQAAKDKATAAALKAASEKQAKVAEDARKRAELAAAKEAACKSEQAKLEDMTAKGSGGSGI
jgi:membrane protein involved in colicin uptake